MRIFYLVYQNKGKVNNEDDLKNKKKIRRQRDLMENQLGDIRSIVIVHIKNINRNI